MQAHETAERAIAHVGGLIAPWLPYGYQPQSTFGGGQGFSRATILDGQTVILLVRDVLKEVVSFRRITFTRHQMLLLSEICARPSTSQEVMMSEPTLNLPFTGIASFCRLPVYENLEELDADVAVIGAPYDLGTQYRSGARFGPRGIRIGSALYGLRGVSYYDHEFDTIFLEDVRIVDAGDVDMVHMRPELCLQNIETAVRTIVSRGAMPVVLGGDHSVPIPVVRGLEDRGPFCVVQLDAHLDFVDERFGVREGHGNVMRRISEMPHVTGIAQIGIRGPGSSDPSDFEDAKRAGSVIIGPREFKRLGVDEVVNRIPGAERYYVTIDADVFDPFLAPGDGSPSFGGLDYYEVTDVLRGVARKGDVVGFDFVEVAPAYDLSDLTGQLAARVILDFLGAIFHERAHREEA
jgi:agmatinase